MQIGIIAEEREDVDVVKILISKVIPENSFGTKSFVGHGCGKIKRKCESWADLLLLKGCDLLIVVHDLDREKKNNLKNDLESRISSADFKDKIVIIPTEELEAWLLSDPIALKRCFNLKKIPKIPNNPESIESPKEYLTRLIWKIAKKRFTNTIHNKKIARLIDLSALSKCKSFQPLPSFLEKNFEGQ